MAGLKANLQGAGAAQQDGPSVSLFLNLTPSLLKIRHVSLQLAAKERTPTIIMRSSCVCEHAVTQGERGEVHKPAFAEQAPRKLPSRKHPFTNF